MGASVMNSNYKSDELHSLVELSFDDELGQGNGKEQKNEEVKKFSVFKLVAKAECISFEKDMLFTTPKQFKEAITEYAVHVDGGSNL